MKHKQITILFVALVVTTLSWASNVITYTATEKLQETEEYEAGLHINAFNVPITSHAFDKTTKIGTITFSDDVVSIGESAFAGCSGLTSVTIPTSVTSIGDNAFSYCTGMTSVTIPTSVTSIGYNAFGDCRGLTSITIPESVTTIKQDAFDGCTGLTSIIIPSSVTEIGDNAFSNCSKLVSVTINSNAICNLTYSLVDIFGNKVEEYIVGSAVISIGESAFSGCTGMTSVTIPTSVTSIGESAFAGCSGMTSVVIPSSVITIGESAFDGCSGLTSVVIPNSVTEIERFTFYDCNSLTTITIPSSVTTMGERIFENCTKLSSVTINSNAICNNTSSLIDIFGNEVQEYILGSSVTSIGTSAFEGCSGLTSITIPSSVTSIGDNAFSYCTGMTSVTIPTSVTSIGYNAFGDCRGLTSITIPESVTTIKQDAFDGCTGLTSINSYAITPPSCESDCFYGVTKSIPVYVPDASVDAYKTADEWKDFTNIRGLSYVPAIAPANTILWGETFAHFSTATPSQAGTGTGTTIFDDADIAYTQSSTNTKGYNEALAEGTAPELLLAKNNGTWTISNIKTGLAKEMSLTFLSNRTTFDLTCSSSAYTISGSEKNWTLTLQAGQKAPEIINLTLTNTETQNARIDNVVLKVTTAAEGASTESSLTVSPSAVDFGIIALGESVTAQNVTATLINTDHAIVSLSGANADAFEIVSGEELSETGTIMVQPKAATLATIGSYAASLDVKADGVEETKSVSLSLVVTELEIGIGFEKVLAAYTDWTFDNIVTQQNAITAHKGIYYGSNGNATTASITTKTKVNPTSLSCFVSKTSTNTSESAWSIQVSFDSITWTDIKSQDATTMTKGEWVKLSDNTKLPNYTNVYVRVHYTSVSTAIRAIDDVVLTTRTLISSWVAISACENGSIMASTSTGNITFGDTIPVQEGTIITLINSPAEGYKFGAYNVHKANDETTQVSVNDDGQFIMPAYPITISATFNAVQIPNNIDINTDHVKKTFWKGETFVYDGLVVTAHYTMGDETVIPTSVTGYNMDNIGVQTITVGFTEGDVTKEKTYEIVVRNTQNDKATAFTVAEAIEIIKAEVAPSAYVYVKGIVNKIDSYNEMYNSLTYWISDDGESADFQIYSGKDVDSTDFSAITDLAIAEPLIIYGVIKDYVVPNTDSTIYEMDKNNYIVDRAPALQLVLPKDTIEKGQKIQMTLSVDDIQTIDLPIALLTSNELLQFSEAVIKAGEKSCQIEVSAIDDYTSSLAVDASIVATAKQYAVGSVNLVIAEDFPNMTFSLSSNEHQESDGPICMTATFTRTNKIDRPITLVLDDNSADDIIYSQTFFTMPAGVETATLQLGIEDNGIVDGDRDVEITASIRLDKELYKPMNQTIHIIDNDVPTLSLTATTNSLVEGKSPAGKLTISRNTSIAEALNININSNNDENLTYEHQVQIPAGETSVIVPIAVASDDVENNSHEVKFTISAEGFVGTEYYAIVADNTFADACIESFSVDKNIVTVGDEVTFDVEISNKGVIPLSKGIRLDLYSSNSDYSVQSVSLTEPLLPNDTRHFSFMVTMPNVVGKYRYYVTINEDEVVRELFFNNNESDHVVVEVNAPYQVTSVTADKSQCQMGDSITISGVVEGEKISNMPVEIYVINENYRSAITISTDEQGRFSWRYAPAIGQSGRMNIGACYPQTDSKQTMTTVDYYSLNVQTRYLQCMLTKGESLQQQIELFNPCGVSLHNVHVVLPATSEIQGDLQSVSITSQPITELEGREHATLALQLKSDILSSEKNYTIIPLRIISDEGTTNEIPLYVYCRNKKGELVLSVDEIETTMSAQSPHDYLLYFYNVGAGETGEISLSLPNWMTMVGASTIPSIPAGEEAKVMLRMTSTDDMQLNVARTGQIGINPTNCEGMALPYNVMLVSTDKGTLHVDVCDEYTYYTEQAPHVQAAQVLVKNPSTGAVVYQGLTNENGIYETELPEGYYILSVSANNHDAYQATIFVEPNRVNNNIINLSVRAIELSWKVEETEIEDKYEIITTIKYETNVPAPVVVVNAPSSIEADKLNDGESLIYTVTITNQGLIRAEDVTISLPDGGSDFMFEALAYGTPFNLEAKQTVTMPVRVTRIPQASGVAARKMHQIMECHDNMITLYYWDCGTDRKWHQYGVPLIYANCDGIPTGEPCQGDGCGGTTLDLLRPITHITGPGNGGGWGPGNGGGRNGHYTHTDDDNPIHQSNPDEGCEPCQNQILHKMVLCGLSFTPAGERLDHMMHILHCYNAVASGLNHDLRSDQLVNCIRGFLPDLDDFFPWLKPIYCLQDFLEPCDHTAENAAAPSRKASLETDEQTIDEPQYITDFRNKVAIAVAEMDSFQNLLNAIVPQNMAENVTMAERADLFDAILIYKNILATKEDLQPFRPSAMTDAAFDMFVERVQNTYRITHGEEVASANYIDSEEVITIWNSIIELENLAQEKGYESTSQLLMQSYELFQKQLEQASTSVCASVTLQFNQKMVMTRQAFRGTLTVLNGHETKAMENAHLNLTIYDEQGHLATDHEFEVHVETLSGFVGELSFDSEQGWQLPANTTGIATIMFIPTKYAAQTQNQQYSFGGTFSYVDPFTGLVVTRDLFPVTMTVKPTPILDMTYFVQRDVISDDPLTEDTIEPTEPAEFALLINNVGYGDAANVQMVTNAPKIVDNEKGLLIDFALLGARLNGKESHLPIDSCVATEFGTIPAQSQAYAQWYFTGSLLGHFTEYSIAATHLTSYDNPDLSLLNQVTVHEMIHTIQVPAEINASTVGWLVNDEVDIQDVPDKLYTSSAEILPLHIATDVKLTSVDAQTYRLTATPSETGWNYGTAMDPSNGKQQLISVIRESDNQEISLQNVWVTSVTLQDGLDPVHEYRIHIADLLTGETSYLLSFSEKQEEKQDTTYINSLYSLPKNITYETNIYIATNGIADAQDENISINSVTIETDTKQSGQLLNADNLTAQDVYMRLRLEPNQIVASPSKWYAFAVPFTVDIQTGITRAYGKKTHVSGSDFQIMEYDGNQRATTQVGWTRKMSGLLQPGKFYMIGIEGSCNDWLFQKEHGVPLIASNQINTLEYPSASVQHSGWNALGNSQLEYTMADIANVDYALTYDNTMGIYMVTLLEEETFAVGSPFFVQVPSNGVARLNPITLQENSPARMQNMNPSRLALTLLSQNNNVCGKAFITLSNDKQEDYQIGRDLLYLNGENCPIAQLWIEHEGQNLAVYDTYLSRGQHIVPLGFTAPSAGNYTLSALGSTLQDVTIELLYNGSPCAILPVQNYGLQLEKGVTRNYSLRITSKGISTNENLITHDEKYVWYDILGRKLSAPIQGVMIRKGSKQLLINVNK